MSGPIDRLLSDFLDTQVDELVELDPALATVGREIAGLVAAGGKRLRPAFVYWGHRATGADHDHAVLHPAGAVELLHTFALIHDDVMDRSDERRGRPAVHSALTTAHADEGLAGDPAWFGVGGAILAGDLAFVWADRLLDEAAVPVDALERARRVFTQLRVEVMAGQYLDLRLAGDRGADEERARRVALLKSGRYTVTRPLQLGAALGEEGSAIDDVLTSYGDAVGLAFQLRDDVLGLFGDPAETGKGATEDLREGKRTLLVLRALAFAGEADRATLEATLGQDHLGEDDADRARQIVVDSGALRSVERLLSAQHERAHEAAQALPEPARAALVELADRAVARIE
ncbi:polyprenyl synthetase family protein [Egibacter rhizosphaerae]|uniref:polyprenyl synthetase family protein n=1 Tax=Egibacter rhizosphaerae TaxID=1670831 RepID=UPI0013F16D40|nr:polyprenyl synthetase family protein [Egibacter rhizosphaerae]